MGSGDPFVLYRFWLTELIYGRYLLCTRVLQVYNALTDPAQRRGLSVLTDPAAHSRVRDANVGSSPAIPFASRRVKGINPEIGSFYSLLPVRESIYFILLHSLFTTTDPSYETAVKL